MGNYKCDTYILGRYAPDKRFVCLWRNYQPEYNSVKVKNLRQSHILLVSRSSNQNGHKITEKAWFICITVGINTVTQVHQQNWHWPLNYVRLHSDSIFKLSNKSLPTSKKDAVRISNVQKDGVSYAPLATLRDVTLHYNTKFVITSTVSTTNGCQQWRTAYGTW